MCARQKRHRIPFPLRQPRMMTNCRWLSTNRSEHTVGHAVDEGLSCSPSVMPIAAIKARDSHVASRESINRAQALWALPRYIIASSIIHKASTKTLRGKRNRPTGKLPKQTSTRKDKAITTPTMQTPPRYGNLLCLACVFITIGKDSYIFLIDSILMGKKIFQAMI